MLERGDVVVSREFQDYGKYEYLSLELTEFCWLAPVTVEAVKFVQKEWKGITLSYIAVTGFGKIYHPFEVKDCSTLFLKFAELPPTPEAIRKFVGQYGPLRSGLPSTWGNRWDDDRIDGKPMKKSVAWNRIKGLVKTLECSPKKGEKRLLEALQKELLELSKREEPQDYPPLPRLRRDISIESLEFWEKQIWEMNKAYQVWQIIREKKLEFLRKITLTSKGPEGPKVTFLLANLPQEVVSSFKNASEFCEALKNPQSLRSYLPEGVPLLSTGISFYPVPLDSDEPTPEDCFFLLRSWLTGKINSYLRQGVSPFITWRDENFKPYLLPEDLLSAMWLQFYFWVVGEKKFKRCAICGLWEDVTDKTSAWAVHPECALRVRARKYYEKVKTARELYREGKSLEEIASVLGKDPAWVEKQLRRIKVLPEEG